MEVVLACGLPDTEDLVPLLTTLQPDRFPTVAAKVSAGHGHGPMRTASTGAQDWEGDPAGISAHRCRQLQKLSLICTGTKRRRNFILTESWTGTRGRAPSLCPE